MTWEETIKLIRTKPEFHELVEKAYLDENLELNIKRFGDSKEFKETLKIIKTYAPNSKTILDIGCGNGISCINFALKKYDVSAVEPDKSSTVGTGAIKILKEIFKLENLNIYEAFAENINFENNSFDIVYVRQAMHHANELNKFIKECVRVLKPQGLLLTVRDHVIFNEKDKNWFLESHQLHKYYGGENAYSSSEYKNAIESAGAYVVKEIKYFDNVINYFPSTEHNLDELKHQNELLQKKKLVNKLGFIGKNWLVWKVYCFIYNYNPLDEAMVPGRMYSYISIKK